MGYGGELQKKRTVKSSLFVENNCFEEYNSVMR